MNKGKWLKLFKVDASTMEVAFCTIEINVDYFMGGNIVRE